MCEILLDSIGGMCRDDQVVTGEQSDDLTVYGMFCRVRVSGIPAAGYETSVNHPNDLTACGMFCRVRVSGLPAAGWIGGVPGQQEVTPTWRCQPTGAMCPADQVATCPAPALRASLKCPDESCAIQEVPGSNPTPLFPHLFLLFPLFENLLVATLTWIHPPFPI